MVLKTTGLSSRLPRKNRFWKICNKPWDIGKMYPNLAFQAKCHISYLFFQYLWSLWIFFQTDFYVETRGSSRLFWVLRKGSWNFKKLKKISVRVVQMKIWNNPDVQNIKWFPFFINRYLFSWKMYFHPILTGPIQPPSSWILTCGISSLFQWKLA